MATLFVGNLPFTTTEQDLCEVFRTLGLQVQRSRVIRDCISGLSKGFGFVELSPAEDQEKAITELRGTRIGGRTVRAYRMNPVANGKPVNAAQRQGGGHSRAATHVSGRRFSTEGLATENTDEIGARPGARFLPRLFSVARNLMTAWSRIGTYVRLLLHRPRPSLSRPLP